MGVRDPSLGRRMGAPPGRRTGKGRAILPGNRAWPVGLVLLASLLLALLAAFWAKRAIEREAATEFRLSCSNIMLELAENLEGHTQVLQGAAGLWDASSGGVTRSEWRAYCRRLQEERRFGWVQGLGLSLLIPADRLQAHTAQIRAEGFPDYAVKPPGRREAYSSIIYLEPFAGRNLRAFGYDMFSEPVRREAMERARDSRRAALSGKVMLVQETHQDVQAGVLMYVPIYRHGLPLDTVAQRQAALMAWSYSPFRMNDVMAGIFRDRPTPLGRTIRLEVFDRPALSAAALLFDSGAPSPAQAVGATLVSQLPDIALEGRLWALRFTQLGGRASGAGYRRAWVVLAGGVLGALMLSALTFAYLHARDIAEDLASSQAMLARSAGIAGLGSWEWDIASDTLVWSEVLYGWFQWDRGKEPPSFREHFELFHPEDRAGLRAAADAAIASGIPYDMETRIPRPDGDPRICLKRCLPVAGPDGKPARLFGFLLDITERKRAEQALRFSEQKFRTLFEHLAEGVALHELVRDGAGKAVDYRILDVNPSYHAHTGIAAEMAVGRLGTEIYEVDPPPYLEGYGAVAMGGDPIAFETFFPPLEKHFRISVVSPREGQFATVFEDITDRKRSENELRQKNAEMERFTYMISHDLKSPLVTVRTFLGYLEQDLAQGRSDRVAKDVGFIQDAAGRMSGLLDDLLEVSRVGRVVNPAERVSYEDLVRAALAAVAGAIENRGVAVEVHGGPLTLTGDRSRLEEIWQNLVENAVKYMGDEPSPRIEIGVEPQGGEMVFFVRDNGMGIDPRFHEKVFGLFEQLDPSSEGTGLGLALIKRIVELNEGRIEVRSEGPGRGSCFRFTLPLALRDPQDGARA